MERPGVESTNTAAHGLILQSLEAVAASEVDIVPVFFERFFAAHPLECGNFHNPRSSEGLMVNEIMAMLLALAADEDWLAMMLRNQVRTHHDHGDLTLERYRDVLDLFVTVLGDTGRPRWKPAYEAAWREQAARIFALIERYY